MKKSISLAKEQDEAAARITARYVEQAQSGRRPRLSDYLVRYPDFTDVLVDFVVYYHALEEHISQGTSSEALSKSSQLALEHAWRHACPAGEERSRWLIPLPIKKDRRHLSLSSLAKELDLGVDVVVQLERCHIDPTSIPLELSRHLAQVLQQPLYVIQAYFAENGQSGLPGNPENLRQKVAEQQEIYAVPASGIREDEYNTREGGPQVTFRQALIASTHMSDRQKDIWCKIIEHEI